MLDGSDWYSNTFGMSNRRTRVEQAEDTRRRLMTAARTTFLRRGFHAASLDEVAAEAGFTKGVVYSRFSSKAELFLALLQDRIEERVAQITAVSDRKSPRAGTAAISRQWAEALRTNRDWSLLVIEFRVHAARDPELNAKYAAVHARLREAVAQAYRRSVERVGGRSALSPDDVARVGIAAATGLVLEHEAEGHGFSEALYEWSAAALIASAVASPASPPRPSGALRRRGAKPT